MGNIYQNHVLYIINGCKIERVEGVMIYVNNEESVFNTMSMACNSGVLPIGTEVVFNKEKMTITSNSETINSEPAYRLNHIKDQLFLQSDFKIIKLAK